MSDFGRRRWLLGTAAGTAASMVSCRGLEPDPEPATAREPVGRAQSASLSILTYNVLADPVGVPKRIPALLDLLEAADADILALQEVAEWFLPLLHDEGWTRGYYASTFGGRRMAPGGQYILSRHPILESRSLVLPGRQRRTLVTSRIDLGRQHIDVATTHMESFLEDGKTRAAQLDAIFEDVRGSATAIVAGDFNFGDGEQPDTAHLDPAFTDLWTAVHPEDPGYTWNIERSEMARVSSFAGEPSRRLDRILVRSSTWKPSAAKIIGDHPVEVGHGELFPSDHFGLVGELRM